MKKIKQNPINSSLCPILRFQLFQTQAALLCTVTTLAICSSNSPGGTVDQQPKAVGGKQLGQNCPYSLTLGQHTQTFNTTHKCALHPNKQKERE